MSTQWADYPAQVLDPGDFRYFFFDSLKAGCQNWVEPVVVGLTVCKSVPDMSYEGNVKITFRGGGGIFTR